MTNFTVFCGSSPGFDPAHREAAAALGRELASAGIGLVYGGGNVGLMGVLADAALEAGGEVIGVIPQALVERELAHQGCTELHITANMHERKALMAERADGFIALPGGIGTMEELFEVWTWGQLGYHPKPCALINVGGYYDALIAFLDNMVVQGFLTQDHRDMLIVAESVADLIDLLADYVPPQTGKWIGRKDL
ncbi:TIGR00730 family Rossman fold protein [Sphingomonas cavernae]|uniref:Cytokinin riboside 5'-monophosphate phosphoribohydrolase n=1 Tax=Sphingomonas cavernae TaxID=2320861 RepID=A0A418WQ43_9SPHN|nr:TIGR00730 family Rossman fold protein [Sphingomonas cavernae]RJF93346.1 TIGR00730 family Rossman fold protein [Sphingomonas cavernae]